MYLIVGLGNPGKKYKRTRHNIGFIVVEELAKKMDVPIQKIEHKSVTGSFFINGEKVILAKPQTYMNKSGEAVRDIVNYYDIDLEKVLIIYDDIDTKIGKIRLRKKGSGGTHNGMRDIIYQLKTQEIPRLRFGIGRSGEIPLKKYVLGKFHSDNVEAIVQTVHRSVNSIETFLQEGIDLAMNKYNG